MRAMLFSAKCFCNVAVLLNIHAKKSGTKSSPQEIQVERRPFGAPSKCTHGARPVRPVILQPWAISLSAAVFRSPARQCASTVPSIVSISAWPASSS